ncbi:hypothetical protein BSPWISOX_610 [uncultured Gammaproteobacteria bacterium]|nr:hypothetical protein BSPWISOX_610 [uncultured Gammaproteobacteria bacterium]
MVKIRVEIYSHGATNFNDRSKVIKRQLFDEFLNKKSSVLCGGF